MFTTATRRVSVRDFCGFRKIWISSSSWMLVGEGRESMLTSMDFSSRSWRETQNKLLPKESTCRKLAPLLTLLCPGAPAFYVGLHLRRFTRASRIWVKHLQSPFYLHFKFPSHHLHFDLASRRFDLDFNPSCGRVQMSNSVSLQLLNPAHLCFI
jgi:hypothetical protein